MPQLFVIMLMMDRSIFVLIHFFAFLSRSNHFFSLLHPVIYSLSKEIGKSADGRKNCCLSLHETLFSLNYLKSTLPRHYFSAIKTRDSPPSKTLQ